nr:hypothetical protein CFP56_15611 [Quercus suber]
MNVDDRGGQNGECVLGLPIVSRRGVALSLGKRVVSWIRTCNSNSRDPPFTTLSDACDLEIEKEEKINLARHT